MLVFVCASNLTVPKVLSVVAENPSVDFRILTPVMQIKQFFDILFPEDKTIVFQLPGFSLSEYSTTSKAVSNYSYLKEHINRCKKSVLNKMALGENFTLYFELYYFAEFELWLVKELSKKSKEVYYMKGINVDPEKAHSFNGTIYRYLNRWLYSTSITPVLSTGVMTGLITANYLNELGAKTITMIPGEKTADLILNKMPELREKKIILLAGGIVRSNLVTEETYSSIAKELGQEIENVFDKKEVAVKSHPVYIEYYSAENNYGKIDPVIPFNVLLNKDIKLVIGFSSAALYEASMQKEITVISTVELFKGKIKEEIYNENKNYLLKNMNAANPIRFPKSIGEFSEILKSAA